MSKREITPEQYFLEGYRRCIEIERIIVYDLAERRARATSISGSWHGEDYIAEKKRKNRDGTVTVERYPAWAIIPHGGCGENLSMSGVDAYLDIEDERLREAKGKTEAVRADIVKMLEAMENKRFARVLLYRYICEYAPSWEAIAEMMGRERRTVCRWHDDALALIEIPKKYLENVPQCP